MARRHVQYTIHSADSRKQAAHEQFKKNMHSDMVGTGLAATFVIGHEIGYGHRLRHEFSPLRNVGSKFRGTAAKIIRPALGATKEL